MNPIEQIRLNWIDQQMRLAAQINETNASEYLQACRNWAQQMGTQGRATAQKPVAPAAVEAVLKFGETWVAVFQPTDRKVSDLAAESFRPAFGTDANAIGGPVGGPVPNQPATTTKPAVTPMASAKSTPRPTADSS